jgi:hypothetical protein
MTATTQKTSLIRRPGAWLVIGIMAGGLALTGCLGGDKDPRCPSNYDPENPPLCVMQDSGSVFYQGSCTGCHGLEAEGHPGAVPPLANADYLMNNKRKTIEIVLAGYSDSLYVNGVWYMSDMPSFYDKSDFEIASILSYLRTVRNDSTVVSCDPDDVDEEGRAACVLIPRSKAEMKSDFVTVAEVKVVRDSLIEAGVIEEFIPE